MKPLVSTCGSGPFFPSFPSSYGSGTKDATAASIGLPNLDSRVVRRATWALDPAGILELPDPRASRRKKRYGCHGRFSQTKQLPLVGFLRVCFRKANFSSLKGESQSLGVRSLHIGNDHPESMPESECVSRPEQIEGVPRGCKAEFAKLRNTKSIGRARGISF